MALILLLGFTLSYFLHLTARLPILGQFRFDLLLGGGALLVIFLKQGTDALRLDQETARNLNRFLLYVLLSLPLVTWPGSVLRLHMTDWIKVALFFVLVVGTVRTERHLRLLVAVFLGCQLFRMAEPLYLHLTAGYWGDVAYSLVGGSLSGLDRLSGAPHDVVNSTQLAWVIVGTVPFLFYLLWHGGRWGQMLFVALAVPSVKTMLLTGARSGLLSLLAVIFGMILLSTNRRRNLMIALVLLVPVGVVVFGQMSQEMQTRYLSLVDSNVTGADTKQGRINGMIRQLGTISHNPLFGNGLGTTREVNWNISGGSSQITHNLYIEILQCTGLIGFSIFMLYIISIIRSLRQTRQILVDKGYGERDWLWRVSSATLAWVIMDLFYSISCFGLLSWEWYFFGGMATVCLALARERSHKEEMPKSDVSFA